jgi:hypothetical protein
MGWRLWRRVRIAPGVTLNVGKSGPTSVSFGPRGLKLTAGRRGRRITAGLPGTGLFYTQQLSSKAKVEGLDAPPQAAGAGLGSADLTAKRQGVRGFWTRRSFAGKSVIVVVAIFIAAQVANGGSSPGPSAPASGAGAVVPSPTPHLTTGTASPTVTPTPVESTAPPTPTKPGTTPSAVPTSKPAPTPEVRTTDDLLGFSKAKTALAGRAGTYTWSSISFSNQLAKLTWTAKASGTTACKVSWRVSPDEYSYLQPFGATTKVSKGSSASGSKQLEVDEISGALVVTSTCPKWTLSGSSFAPPPGWNPWGYNFAPGKVIYSPPADFCSYFDCISNFGNSAGYVVQCSDGTFSTAGGRQGACSYHGGVRRTLYRH